MVRAFSVLIPLALALAAPCGAASFDCRRAVAADERAVCASRVLNDRDVAVALLYRLDRGFLAMGGRGALEDDQRAWLRDRRRCGADAACLMRVYDRRIGQLEGTIARVRSRGPF